MARAERKVAWTHAKRIPARAGDAASAFAKQHPIMAMGGAAALAMGIVSRRHHKAGREGKPSSWPMALGAVGVRWLPEIMRVVGLTIPKPNETSEDDEEAKLQRN